MENCTTRSQHKIMLNDIKSYVHMQRIFYTSAFSIVWNTEVWHEKHKTRKPCADKTRRIFMLCNYEKFVFLQLVESTGLTVLALCRPSEQFSPAVPRCTLQPRLKWRDCLVTNISRFPWCILSHEILTVLPMPSVSTAGCWIHTAVRNYLSYRRLNCKNTSLCLIWAGLKPAAQRWGRFIAA